LHKGVTEIVKMPGRGHSLTIDARWRDVAEKALEFVKRFTTMRQDAIKQDDLGRDIREFLALRKPPIDPKIPARAA
jgi:hypothetical protein